MRWSGLGARLGFSGAVAVGAALATGELLAGVLSGVPSPLLAVAQFIIDIQPPGAKDIAVALFGTADKVAFQVIVVVIALAIGALLGRLADRRPTAAAAVIMAFVGAGFVASLRDASASLTLAAAAAGVEAVVGVSILRRLVDLAHRGRAAETDSRAGMPDWRRRSLLQAGGALAIGSFVAGAAGRYLLERQRTPIDPGGVPAAPRPADVPPGADLATADL